jgi:hypothetical protein
MDILKLHKKLSSPLYSVLTQMRTGNVGLRQFLHRRRVPGYDNASCECGRGEQTVAHVLLNYLRLIDLRKEMWGRGRQNH